MHLGPALLLGLAAALSTPAAAQVDDLLDDLLGDEPLLVEGELEGGQPAPLGASLRGWQGFLELKPRVYLADRGGPEHDEQLLLEGELELDFKLAERTDAYLRPRVFLDLVDGDLERFDPLEAYVTYRGEGWDLRAGQFVENWGIVDTYNPVDVVSRRDFATDFLDAQRQGELGLRLRRFLEGGETLGEPTVSAYLLPVWQETRFPTDDQRFGFGSDALPFLESRGVEPRGSERLFSALRFASTLSTAPVNADLQLVVADGPERTPYVEAWMLGPQAVLRPVYFAATTVGLGFRAVPNQDVAGRFLSTLTLKAEVVYKDPRSLEGVPDPDPDDYVAYVVGVDRSFYGLLGEQDELTLTVELAGERGAEEDPIGRFRPFRDDLIVRAFYQPGDFARTSLELRGLYDLDSDESIHELIFERQLRGLHEDLRGFVQLQHFEAAGDGSSLFDFFPDNSSVALGIRLDF